MESKDQFLANTSHELRTPIQTIIGMTELLMETKLDREQDEYCRQIRFSADVLLSLINDILDYSKLESGKMLLEKMDFNLEEALEQPIEMISLEAHKKGLELSVDIPPAAQRMTLGDPGKLRQVVINLVKNAVKFTEEGSVSVSAVILPDKEGGEILRVSVADTGIGISEEARGKLFKDFVQADVSTTRRFGGTGLGLAISKSLVELMGGTIGVMSAPGGGSVFYFTLPLEKSELPYPPLPEIPRRDSRVLVVDDSPLSRRIAMDYLRDLGYHRVDAAGSGEEALAMMRSAWGRARSYELCLIDMIMPHMDGWRLAAEINADHNINSARLVLMVSHGMLGAEAKMTLLRWFNGYIHKPLERRDLAIHLSEVFEEGPLDLEPASPQEESRQPRAANKAGTILVVEDHSVNRKLFCSFLDRFGLPYIEAVDGEEALEKAQSPEIALIFMDIQMPRMNGWDACARMRRGGIRCPIIAVTASAFQEERDRCLEVGFDDVLLKPYKRDDIRKLVNEWLGKESLWGRGDPRDKSEDDEGPPVFDVGDLMDTFMGNRDLARQLLGDFLERSTPLVMEKLPEALEAGDREEGRRISHTLKGSSLTLSGKELGQEAAHLEKLFKEGNLEEAPALIAALQEAYRRFEEAARDFIGG